MKKHFAWLLAGSLLLAGCTGRKAEEQPVSGSAVQTFDLTPEYPVPFVLVSNGIPEKDLLEDIEGLQLSGLDELGRTGTARALLSRDTITEEERSSIADILPAGFQNQKTEDGYLYNRCHLVGYQLAGSYETVNTAENLMTGTRYLNIAGMLPFENQIAQCLENTQMHVAYQAEPVYQGSELVPRGLNMQACSLEDDCETIGFNVYFYNVQPGYSIEYSTGEAAENSSFQIPDDAVTYILNTNTRRIHLPDCESAAQTKSKNKTTTALDLQTLKYAGYVPCSICLKDERDSQKS